MTNAEINGEKYVKIKSELITDLKNFLATVSTSRQFNEEIRFLATEAANLLQNLNDSTRSDEIQY